VATWQQIITFEIIINTSQRIYHKRLFVWRLETNEIMITSVKVEFECWTCSQHEEMNGKKHKNENTQQVTMPKFKWF